MAKKTEEKTLPPQAARKKIPTLKEIRDKLEQDIDLHAMKQLTGHELAAAVEFSKIFIRKWKEKENPVGGFSFNWDEVKVESIILDLITLTSETLGE